LMYHSISSCTVRCSTTTKPVTDDELAARSLDHSSPLFDGDTLAAPASEGSAPSCFYQSGSCPKHRILHGRAAGGGQRGSSADISGRAASAPVIATKPDPREVLRKFFPSPRPSSSPLGPQSQKEGYGQGGAAGLNYFCYGSISILLSILQVPSSTRQTSLDNYGVCAVCSLFLNCVSSSLVPVLSGNMV
jgi:hypothetical protein